MQLFGRALLAQTRAHVRGAVVIVRGVWRGTMRTPTSTQPATWSQPQLERLEPSARSPRPVLLRREALAEANRQHRVCAVEQALDHEPVPQRIRLVVRADHRHNASERPRLDPRVEPAEAAGERVQVDHLSRLLLQGCRGREQETETDVDEIHVGRRRA